MSAAALTPNLAHRSRRNSSRAQKGTERGSAPVRRNSVSSEEPDRHTRNLSLGQRRELLTVIKSWNEANRGKQGVAPLTPAAIHVAEVMLFRLQDRVTGRIDHALTWIARTARRAYQTVVDAIGQLEAAGILAVLRRCRRGDDPDSPPWVQDTNLYRFELPAKIKSWWAQARTAWKARQKGRLPEDVEHAADAAAAANQEQEQDLFGWWSDEARAAKRAADLARDVRGPGAAKWRASLNGS